jgi:Putative auto-transporter adhesin, head GIN domain
MKRIGIIIFAVALVIGLVVTNMFSFGRLSNRLFHFSVDFGGVSGSGNVVTEKRDLAGFKSVEVGGTFEVEITAQKDFSVTVEADDNLIPLIRTEVNGGTLRIEADKRLSSKNPIRVRIFAPDIEKLDVSGVANVTLGDLKNHALSLESSGASKVKIAGETAKLTVDVSGATKIDAADLKAVDAEIDASGASHVDVNVSGELRADGSGASKITYTGTPANIVKTTSGASHVSQK